MRREEVEALLDEALDAIGSFGYVDAEHLAALCRRWLAVEDAPCVPVIDGGMMIRPFFQYGRFDLPDDGENPATKEARLLGQFVGQRVRIVPEAGQGVDGG